MGRVQCLCRWKVENCFHTLRFLVHVRLVQTLPKMRWTWMLSSDGSGGVVVDTFTILRCGMSCGMTVRLSGVVADTLYLGGIVMRGFEVVLFLILLDSRRLSSISCPLRLLALGSLWFSLFSWNVPLLAVG